MSLVIILLSLALVLSVVLSVVMFIHLCGTPDIISTAVPIGDSHPGDVASDISLLEETLRLFMAKYKRVFYTPGTCCITSG